MTRVLQQAGAIAGVLLAIVLGAWFWGAVVAPGFWTAVACVVAWFLVIGTLTARLGRRRPSLKRALRLTYFATAAAAVSVGWWTSVRETTVDETVVTGVPASRLPPAELDALAPQGGAAGVTPGEAAPSVDDLLAPQP